MPGRDAKAHRLAERRIQRRRSDDGDPIAAVSKGEIAPVGGAAVTALLEQYRRALEASDFEARISAQEARQ
jgi:hypothetical protein